MFMRSLFKGADSSCT